ncbi:MAG: hypothetical protein DRG39_07000, partial [Deltaproteobacteria bacterium]
MLVPYTRAKEEILYRLSEAEKWTGHTKDFRIARLNAQLAEIEGVLSACAAEAGGTLQKTLNDLALSESETYHAVLADKFAPIGINIMRLPYAQIDWILRNPLIYQYRKMDIGEDLLWNNKAAVDLMRTQLTQSIISGEDMARAARRLVKPGAAYGLAEQLIRDRAETIVRSEIQHVSNEVARGVFEQNQDVLKGVMYTATLDRRTCLICAADDGRVFRFKDGGVNAPPLPRHPRRRCCYSPVTKSWKELGADVVENPMWKSYFTGEVYKPITYEAWLKSLDPEDAKDILGAKRYQMWVEGKVKLAQMATQHRVLTVRELERKAAKRLKKEGERIRDEITSGLEVKSAEEVVKQFESLEAVFKSAPPDPWSLKEQVCKCLAQRMDKLGLPEWRSLGNRLLTKDSEDLARKLIKSWAVTSGDNNELSVALQLAVKNEFGLKGATTWWKATALRKGERFYKEFEVALRHFVRGMYKETQDFLKAKGIKTLRVVRGVGSSVKGEISTPENPLYELEIRLQPMSSFSSNIAEARKFAMFGDKETVSLVFAEVPASRVLSCPFTGFGCLEEEEWVILGARRRGGEKVLASTIEQMKAVTLGAKTPRIWAIPWREDLTERVAKD